MAASAKSRAITTTDLEQVDAFSVLDEAGRELILAQGRAQTVVAEAPIVDHLATTRDVYFVLTGEVRVNMVAQSGRQITYQLLPPGTMFGELAALDNLPRSASVYAEKDSKLLSLNAATFNQLVAENQAFAMVVLQRLTGLCRTLAEKVFEYHTYDVKGRVYSELLRLHELRLRSDEDVTLRITARDMASRVGTTRENVSRIYSALHKSCIVVRDTMTIKIVDVEALEALLDASEFG